MNSLWRPVQRSKSDFFPSSRDASFKGTHTKRNMFNFISVFTLIGNLLYKNRKMATQPRFSTKSVEIRSNSVPTCQLQLARISAQNLGKKDKMCPTLAASMKASGNYAWIASSLHKCWRQPGRPCALLHCYTVTLLQYWSPQHDHYLCRDVFVGVVLSWNELLSELSSRRESLLPGIHFALHSQHTNTTHHKH